MERHVNPTSDGRTALAPYNFVPLPERVYPASEVSVRRSRESHDGFLREKDDAFSGWVDLAIEALTPVFTRGPVTWDPQTEHWDTRETRLRPEPYTTPEGNPALPGSSLRGMVRTLVEILSSGRLSPVTTERSFFRTVAADRIGARYRSLLVRNETGHRGGFAQQQRDRSWRIQPVTEVLRVGHEHISGLEYRQHPNYRPAWELQHRPCWFTRGDRRFRVAKLDVSADRPQGVGWEAGVLVLTGSAPRKKKEFVFVGTEDSFIEIPDDIMDRFHSDDQVSQWQEQAFPRNQPTVGARRAAGHLRDGEPVFFVCNDTQGLEFFGRAGMFRYPYDKSPASLLPAEQRADWLDVADAMFGRVFGRGRQRCASDKAIRGRVRFEDAVAVGNEPMGGWFEPPMVPAILSSPKVTAFQHYLTQDGRSGLKALTTYIEGDRTIPRGHKLYWHRWDTPGLANVRHREHIQKLHDLQGAAPTDKQCTVIRPVKSAVRFAGRVHFDNLTAFELGALLTALRLPTGCAHKIGMAKPLGLGSVAITPRLSLLDRTRRYGGWADAGVKEGEEGERYERVFVNAMVEHARTSGEAMFDDRHDLASIGRIDALYALLSWQERPPLAATRSMVIEGGDSQRYCSDTRGKVNEFRDRPVLPTPQAVVRRPEPRWRGETPTPASDRGWAPTQPERAPTTQPLTARMIPARTPPNPRAPATPPVRPKEPGVGTKVHVEVLEERTRKGGLMFRVVGTEWKGVLHPTSPQPPDPKPGTKLELVVATGGGTLQFKYVPA